MHLRHSRLLVKNNQLLNNRRHSNLQPLRQHPQVNNLPQMHKLINRLKLV